MNYNKFFSNYIQEINDLLSKIDTKLINQTIEIIKKKISLKSTIYIAGNGGSSSIASHISVDFTKVARIKSLTFNNSNIITCFANDYGFEHWVEKAIDFYGDDGDLLIVISSSGRSENMLNGVKAARNGNFHSVVTLSGFAQDNPLNQLGDINLWLDSRAYNFVESVHQIWLLTIVDLIIGSREYSA